MPITIGSNINSLKAQRQLSNGTKELSKTFERLSSGLRINKSSDDAAGLAISESLKSDKRVLNQGVRNFNDGISLLNIADGAIENLSNIVTRLKELAEQSANGSYSTIQRKAIDREAQALSKEYIRIAQSTTFNGKQIFAADADPIRIQGGYGVNGGIQSTLGGTAATGNFYNSNSYATAETYAAKIIAADLNSDGISDLISGGDNGLGSFSVLMGRGDGGFYDATSYSTSNAGTLGSFDIGDINRDGKLDIISVGNGDAVVRMGVGDGTFGDETTYNIGTGSGPSRAIKLGDLNGDSILDIIAADYDENLAISLGGSDGTFGQASHYGGVSLSTTVAIDDLNNDGRLDVVTTGSSAFTSIFFGNGSGSFSSIISFTDPINTYAISLGDVNGDYITDIISAGYYSGEGKISVRLGSTGGNFSSSVSVYSMDEASSRSIELGDINGDGNLDIVTGGVTSGGTGTITARLGNGNGTFGSSTCIHSTILGVYGLALDDINNDDVIDILNQDSSVAEVNLGRTSNGISALAAFKLTSQADARDAFSLFDRALNRLSTQRGTIGAFQSRINVGTSVLQATSENYAAAESRIRDVDIADESSKLVRLNILQQAASSVLAQANLQPALALQLLKN